VWLLGARRNRAEENNPQTDQGRKRMADASCRKELELEIPADEVSKATEKVAADARTAAG